jgi:transposase-like protein
MSGYRIMELAEIVAALQDRNLVKVSQATGIHWNTLHKWKQGHTEDPKISTVVTLSKYLQGVT